MSGGLPVCTSLAQCTAHDGERVEVVGVYTVWDPMPVRHAGMDPAQQVVLVFDGGEEGPYLGAWGHPGHLRDLAEIAALGGRRVRATGTFRATMPPHPSDPPQATALAGPCLHPIEAVTPA
jgi:hypothetical protein